MVLLARDGAPSGRACQCEQADDGSCLCSMATGAPALWRPTAGPSRRSQRRARPLDLHHFEFGATHPFGRLNQALQYDATLFQPGRIYMQIWFHESMN